MLQRIHRGELTVADRILEVGGAREAARELRRAFFERNDSSLDPSLWRIRSIWNAAYDLSDAANRLSAIDHANALASKDSGYIVCGSGESLHDGIANDRDAVVEVPEKFRF